MFASEIPLECLIRVIRSRYDRCTVPHAPPLASWSDLLKPGAEDYARLAVARRMVERWHVRLADPDATTRAKARRSIGRWPSRTSEASRDVRRLDPRPGAPGIARWAVNDECAAGLPARFGRSTRNGKPIFARNRYAEISICETGTVSMMFSYSVFLLHDRILGDCFSTFDFRQADGNRMMIVEMDDAGTISVYGEKAEYVREFLYARDTTTCIRHYSMH